MTLIGSISLTQIQRDPLKRGEEPNRIYHPGPLLQVKKIKVTREGVWGLGIGNQWVVDAHNVHHPRTRNLNGMTGTSIGFIGHYKKMQERFGAHMVPGVAGENIIIDGDHPYTLDELAGGLVIESAETGEKWTFEVLKAMAPCDPFSHFAAKTRERLPADKLKSILQFLGDGRRGFVVMPKTENEVFLHPGDKVYLA